MSVQSASPNRTDAKPRPSELKPGTKAWKEKNARSKAASKDTAKPTPSSASTPKEGATTAQAQQKTKGKAAKKRNFGPRPEDQERLGRRMQEQAKRMKIDASVSRPEIDDSIDDKRAACATNSYRYFVLRSKTHVDGDVTRVHYDWPRSEVRIPRMPRPFENLNPDVVHSLSASMSGSGRPYVGAAAGCNKVKTTSPFLRYVTKCLLGLAVEKLVGEKRKDEKLTTLSLDIFGSNAHVAEAATFFGQVLTAISDEAKGVINHWTTRPLQKSELIPHQVKNVQYVLNHMSMIDGVPVLEGVSRSADLFPSQAILCMDGVAHGETLELCRAAYATTFYEVAPYKPVGVNGFIGNVIKEATWDSFHDNEEFQEDPSPECPNPEIYKRSMISITTEAGSRPYVGLRYLRTVSPTHLYGYAVHTSDKRTASFVLAFTIVPVSREWDEDWLDNVVPCTVTEVPRSAEVRADKSFAQVAKRLKTPEAPKVEKSDKSTGKEEEKSPIPEAPPPPNPIHLLRSDPGPSGSDLLEKAVEEVWENLLPPSASVDDDREALAERPDASIGGDDDSVTDDGASGEETEPETEPGSEAADSAGSGEAAQGTLSNSPQAKTARVDIARVSEVGTAVNRNGRLDAVLPVSDSAQRLNSAPTAPPLFTRATTKTGDDRWYWTRAFVSFLFTNGFSHKSVGARLPLNQLLILTSLLSVIMPKFVWVALSFGALRTMKAKVSPPRPTSVAYKLKNLREAELTVDQISVMSRMITNRFKIDKALGEDDLASLAGKISAAIGYEGSCLALLPTIVRIWEETVEAFNQPDWTEWWVTKLLVFLVGLAFSRSRLNPLAASLDGVSPQNMEKYKQQIQQMRDAGVPDDVIAGFFRKPTVSPYAMLTDALNLTCVAPVLEEGTKLMLSVSTWCFTNGSGYPFSWDMAQNVGNAVFGFGESFLYSRMMSNLGVGWGQILAMRAPALLMHLMNTGNLSTRVVRHGLFNAGAWLYTYSDDVANFFGNGSWVGATLPLKPLGWPAPSLCVKSRPVKPIRDGNVLRIRRPLQDCKATISFRLAGPFVTTHTPYSFRSCEHNLLAALTSRGGGVPKVFATDDSKEHRRVIDDNVSRDFPAARAVLASLCPKLTLTRYDYTQWVERFEPAKRDMLSRAFEDRGPEYDLRYKCFVKREKSVAETLDLEGLVGELTSNDKDGSISSRDEFEMVPNQIEKLDPRLISVPHEAVRVAGGPWCWALNEAMHNHLNRQVYYNPGSNQTETSAWFEEACSWVATGAKPWALAIQGDDSLLIYRHPGDRVVKVLLGDVSRYDMSIRISHYRQVWEMLRTWDCEPPEDIKRILQDQDCITSKSKKYLLGFGAANIVGTMASGNGTTITFNSLILSMALISYAQRITGGDFRLNFPQLMATFGFAVTYQEATLEMPLGVDFLQCRPWLTSDARRLFGPKPGRILARFFWVDREHRNSEGYMRESRTLSIGLLSIANHIPVINDLCRRIIHLTNHLSGVRVRAEAPEEIQRWYNGEYAAENPCTVQEMADFYGLLPSDINNLRTRCSNWNFGEPVDTNSQLTAVVHRLCTVDLE